LTTVSQAIEHRRSVRKYDPSKPINAELVKSCLEKARLAPNSSNLQLYEFYHITSENVLKEISNACFDQPAAKTAIQLVVFVTRKDLWKNRSQANLDFLEAQFNKPKEAFTKREKFATKYYSSVMPLTYFDFLGILGWLKYIVFWFVGLFRPIYRQTRNSDMRTVVHKSAALAAQTFMLSMAEVGYDTCPMEGHDSLRIKKILNLPMGAEINMVVSCGIRLEEGVYGKRFRIPFEKVYYEI
jgi:nitroreductase